MINAAEISLYQRQIILEEIGIEGQLLFKKAKVCVVGAGGLGCPVLLYLAVSGIGTLGIIDFDIVNISNLHRQILFTRKDINKNKAEIAYRRLKLHNPDIQIHTHTLRLTTQNSIDILKNYDIIIDGSDNFETRYLVNDACIELNKPLISGAIYKFEGQVSVFNYKDNFSYRDLFPTPPDSDAFNCSVSGVLASTCMVIAGIMVNELFKVLLGKSEVLSGKILQINLLSMSFNTFKFNKVSKPNETDTK